MPASARAIAKAPDLTVWLNKEQAADALNTSIKTIERMTAAGKLRCAQRPRHGRKPEPVYDPVQLDGLRRQKELLPLTIGDGATPRAMLPASPAFAASPASNPRYLTLQQASAYSGLSATLLRRMIVDGLRHPIGARKEERALPAIRDGREWKIKREDLDKL